MAIKRPGSREHTLELHTGNHIRIPVIAVFAFFLSIKFFKTGCQDNRTDIKLDDLFRHRMVNSMLFAGSNALLALGTQGTIETTLGFCQGSFFRKTFFNFVKIIGTLSHRQDCLFGTRLLFHAFGFRQKFRSNRCYSRLKSCGQHILAFEITINRFRRPLARADSTDNGSTARNVITTGKHAFYGCFQGDFIDLVKITFCCRSHVTQRVFIDRLTDGNDNLVGI